MFFIEILNFVICYNSILSFFFLALCYFCNLCIFQEVLQGVIKLASRETADFLKPDFFRFLEHDLSMSPRPTASPSRSRSNFPASIPVASIAQKASRVSLPFQTFVPPSPQRDEQKTKTQTRQKNKEREHLSFRGNYIPPEHGLAEVLEEYLAFVNRLKHSTEPISTAVSPEQIMHITADIEHVKLRLLRPLIRYGE